MQRGVAVLISSIDVGAKLQREPDRRQRTLSVNQLLPRRQQVGKHPIPAIPHAVAPAGTRRQHQRSPAVSQREHRVSTSLGKYTHDFAFGELCRKRKRRGTEQ